MESEPDFWKDGPIGVSRAPSFEIDDKPYFTFLLGAGASLDAGFPLAAELFSGSYIRLVHRLAHRGDSSPELEKMLLRLHTLKNSASDLQTLYDSWIAGGEAEEINAFEEMISEVMFWSETAAFQKKDREHKVSTLDYLFSFVALLKSLRDDGHGVAVISMNYDLNTEQGIFFEEFNYGSVGKSMVWPKGWADHLGGGLPRFANGISILKPHGSLNWLVCPKCSAITCGRDNMWQARKSLSRLRKCAVCWEGPMRPLFVPPVAAMHSTALNPIWQDVEAVLSRTAIFMVCGYSFPPYDTYVSDRIQRWLSKKANVLVIDPFAFDYPMRYFGLGNGCPVALNKGFAEVMLDVLNVGPRKTLLSAAPLFITVPDINHLTVELLRWITTTSQIESILTLKSKADLLVTQAAIQELRRIRTDWITVDEVKIQYHTDLLERAVEHGLSWSLTRDVLSTFLKEDRPEELIALFAAVGDLFSAPAVEDFFREVEELNNSQLESRITVVRKKQLLRRIMKHGVTEGLAEDARLEKMREPVIVFLRKFITLVPPSDQEACLLEHKELFYYPGTFSIIEDYVEIAVLAMAQRQDRDDQINSLHCQLDLLRRSLNQGIGVTFVVRRHLMQQVQVCIKAFLEQKYDIAQKTVESDPVLLMSNEACEVFFTVFEQQKKSGNIDAALSILRCRRLIARCRECGFESAFAEAIQLRDLATTLSPIWNAFILTSSISEKREILETHQEFLLDDRTQKRLVDALGEIQAVDAPAKVCELMANEIALVRRCKEIGIEAAFASNKSS